METWARCCSPPPPRAALINGSSGGSPSIVAPGSGKTRRGFVQPASPQHVINTSQFARGHGHTPVSLLNQYADKNSLELKYLLESETGPSHQSLATFVVTMAGLRGRGTAATHKKAKQIAAEDLWVQLNNNTAGKGTIYAYLYK